MTVTVNTTDGQMPVAGGVDFVVDWETGAEQPGLAVLDKDESDNSAKQVAYFAPGSWKAVVKT
jgi:hypothetical protein